MTQHDKEYLKMVEYVLQNGTTKGDRTGTGTRSVFSYQMRFDLRDGTIPMLTTKKMHTKSIIHELLWYVAGGRSNRDLNENGVTIWDEWQKEDGDLGPVYGYQWRNWPGYNHVPTPDKDGHIWHLQEKFDQLAVLIDKLKNNPDDRRLLVTAWNVAQLAEMALPPCHYAFQCYSRTLGHEERVAYAIKRNIMKPDAYTEFGTHPADYSPMVLNSLNVPTRELSMMLNQRSADVGLGVPFNIVQYSLLLRMIAAVTNHAPGEFIWNGGDVHIYSNHVVQLEEQLTRTPFDSPSFEFARPIDSIEEFGYNDFVITGYQSHPRIAMDVAV